MTVDAVILAAGRGSRLHTATPKPLLPLSGEPLIHHVLAAVQSAKLGGRIVVVVSPDSEAVQTAALNACPAVRFAVQPRPHGTADAAHCGLKQLGNKASAVMLLCADTPLITAATLRVLARRAKRRPVFLSFLASNPRGYGRILRDGDAVVGIVEEKDASRQQRKINEVYAGALIAPPKFLQKTLTRIVATRARATEHYLTDVAANAAREHLSGAALIVAEEEAMGINTMAELAHAAHALRRRRAAEWMRKGVQLSDPQRVDFRGAVKIGRGCAVDVNVILQNSTLGAGVKIGAHSVIMDCIIGKNTRVEPFCHLQGAVIGAECTLGPYARVRPQTALGDGVFVGNFVEIKNSVLRGGVKAGHLSYLGDADIGGNSNIGAGVITCNYDGKQKHRTVIGNGAFIGSDCQLVAPVRVDSGAYIAAGTTLTHNAPGGHVTLSRVPQRSVRRRTKKA